MAAPILNAGVSRAFALTMTAEEFATCAPEVVWRVRIDGDGALLEASPETE